MDLVKQAGAELVGMGFIIEKAFQHGGDELRSQGIHVESLAIIESLDNCEIKSDNPERWKTTGKRTDLRLERQAAF